MRTSPIKLLQFFTYSFILLSLVACSFGTHTITHNQLDDTLTVEINDKIYQLEPNGLVGVSYEYGKNRIKSTYKNKVIVDTTVTITREMTEKGAMINATGKPYYIMIERYGGSMLDNPIYEQMMERDVDAADNPAYQNYKKRKREALLKRMKIVVIDSTPIIGDIEELPADQIVIPRDWYYQVNSKFEESIEVSNSSETLLGKSVKKIFSEQELLQYWNSQREQLNF